MSLFYYKYQYIIIIILYPDFYKISTNRNTKGVL